MKGDGGLDVDGKLRLIAINYLNRRLIAIKKINRCTALIVNQKLGTPSNNIQTSEKTLHPYRRRLVHKSDDSSQSANAC